MINITHLSKNYGGIHALKDISLNIAENEIHSICGENGAGKSTLIKILAGATQKSSGVLEIDGKKIEHCSPKLSMQLGIRVVYQEFALIEELSIAENIYLSTIQSYSRNAFVNMHRMFKDCKHLLQSLKINFNPKLKVSKLSNSEKQLIEIAKALSKDAKILILDEPTAVLSDAESHILFDTLFRLKETGVTIIYVSHRLKEIFHLSDSISILRDGTCVISDKKEKFSEELVIEHMLGKKRNIICDYNSSIKSKKLDVLMEGKSLCSHTGVNGASFTLRKGEILGIAGIVGSGRTELSRLLFGVDRIISGTLMYNGKSVNFKNVEHAIRLGIALIPESRKDHGCILSMCVGDNIVLPQQNKFLFWRLFLNRKKEIAHTHGMIKKLQIKAQYFDIAKNLSGGNQQKVVLSKWMSMNPHILILDEPTRGIDIGAKDEVYSLIRYHKAQGGTAILISSELFEIMELSDRVYVMNRGRLSPSLEENDINESNIMRYAVC